MSTQVKHPVLAVIGAVTLVGLGYALAEQPKCRSARDDTATDRRGRSGGLELGAGGLARAAGGERFLAPAEAGPEIRDDDRPVRAGMAW